jgi:hypothetical protein
LFLTYVSGIYRWTEEDETDTYFLILFLNFVFVFHFLLEIISCISLRVCVWLLPTFKFFASIYLDKLKEKSNAAGPRFSMHFRSLEYDARMLPIRLTCCTFVYCLCSLLRFVCMFFDVNCFWI